MKLKKCHIENFTVFEQADIEFGPGVNVLIGANATGKSHLLKLLYAMIQALPGKTPPESDDADTFRLYAALNGVFKPEDGEVNSMIRGEDRETPAVLHLESDRGHHCAALRRHTVLRPSPVRARAKVPLPVVRNGPECTREHAPESDAEPARRPWESAQLEQPPGLFIPPNEVLAIYPGFVASYEKRELSFDQTYYDMCKALAPARLRQLEPSLAALVDQLETALKGEVLQKGDRFYVQSEQENRTLEAHLLAEGHRKVAALVHLINNGAITKDTVLFWDEPEANLNPRLIKHIAGVLLKLAGTGIQVFIASHDYLLTGELSLAAEYPEPKQPPVRFFALSRDDGGPVNVQRGDTLAALDGNPILDEFLEHYQREREKALAHMKSGSHG